jgi:hypothetical protein
MAKYANAGLSRFLFVGVKPEILLNHILNRRHRNQRNKNM